MKKSLVLLSFLFSSLCFATFEGKPVRIVNGGTGQATASSGFNALSPMTTLGDIIYGGSSGTGLRLAPNTSPTRQFLGMASSVPTWAALLAADIPSLDFTKISTGVVPILQGGSGQTTANAALNAFLPAQSTHSGQYLQSDGTNSSWSALSSSLITKDEGSILTSSTASYNFAGAGVTATNSGSDVLVTIPGPTAGTGISVSGVTVNLANTAVTAGSYTNSNITVDAQGRITAASNGSGGGSSCSVLSKTANYTILSTDCFIKADATSAAFTLTLPAASGAGQIIYIKKIDAVNAITIARAGSDLIDGETSQTLNVQFQSITLISDGGTSWYVQ